MIDAHVHLWRLGYNDCTWPTAAEGPIHCDIELGDLLDRLDATNVSQALLVQSQESPRDTAWLLEQAAASPRIAGVVGWADLARVNCVAALAGEAEIRGLRPMVQDCAADWYDNPALADGLACMSEAGLVLDALIRPRHLASLARLARRYPALTIVIDHAAKPCPPDWADWRAAMGEAAGLPNVHVKLSGLLTEMAVSDLPPCVDALIALFGAERMIWGSDWPVVRLGGDYRSWLALARSLVPAADHAAVFGGNAARLYRIESIVHA